MRLCRIEQKRKSCVPTQEYRENKMKDRDQITYSLPRDFRVRTSSRVEMMAGEKLWNNVKKKKRRKNQRKKKGKRKKERKKEKEKRKKNDQGRAME